MPSCDMTSEEAPADALPSGLVVELVIEDADLVMLGMDPDRPVATPLMDFCRGALDLLALRPDKVKLVIAGDFVESVKARLPDGPYRDAFDLARGAGAVGAKTLAVDGEVHVVFPAFLFLDSDAAREHLSPEDAEQIVASEELEPTWHGALQPTRRSMSPWNRLTRTPQTSLPRAGLVRTSSTWPIR